MKNLEVIIAKYYFPDELFVGQVKEIVRRLTERLAERLPYDQAVHKAHQFVEKYYLNTTYIQTSIY
ncbi:MAG: hypothetical protein JSV05_03445 [Candidatus Bathyarchaeota archaeon]|nr:MAG: hypothetical protein JSV05_03445 [Candidatus Bathyarchaeota archaeon]